MVLPTKYPYPPNPCVNNSLQQAIGLYEQNPVYTALRQYRDTGMFKEAAQERVLRHILQVNTAGDGLLVLLQAHVVEISALPVDAFFLARYRAVWQQIKPVRSNAALIRSLRVLNGRFRAPDALGVVFPACSDTAAELIRTVYAHAAGNLAQTHTWPQPLPQTKHIGLCSRYRLICLSSLIAHTPKAYLTHPVLDAFFRRTVGILTSEKTDTETQAWKEAALAQWQTRHFDNENDVKQA